MQQQPTYIRILVVAVATLMSLLLYMDRFCISIAEIYIKEDLRLTDTQVGWMLSAFFWTYALGQVPAGWLTDRFGSRIMLTIYVLLWSLFTGLTGLAGSFLALVLLRLGFGFSQAGAYPTAASMVSKWVPFGARGTASGIIAVGGRAGLSLATVATGYMLIVLTPMSTPATLEPGDILDAGRLISDSYSTDRDAIVYEIEDKVAGQFDRDVLLEIDDLFRQDADSVRSAQDTLLEQGRDTSDAVFPPMSLSNDLTAAIASNFNKVIRNPSFFTAEEIAGIKMESEGKRLAAIPVDERTQRQSERLNRLVLEGLYPESIKKLYGTGWRWMMGVYGSLGIVVAALVWWLCRTTPARHPWCNEAS